MSNIKTMPNTEVVKQEAGEWLARLDRGNLSDQEQDDLARWMATSVFHRTYLQRLVVNWDHMDVLSELADLFPLKTTEHAPAGYPRRPFAWIGATAAVLVALAYFATGIPERSNSVDLVQAESPPPVVYHTAIGDFTSVTLQDGSVMKLNTNSLVEVEYDNELRTIVLLRGEASFKVASEADRPFAVRGGNGLALAVGTQFNVRLLNSGVDVTVTEGRVKVIAGGGISQLEKHFTQEIADRDHEVLLSAGESVQYGERIQSLEVRASSDIEQMLAWQQGSLIFNGESLEDAVAEISRYTSQQLLIVDPAINDIPIGGHFKTDDIEGLIAALATNFNIKAEQVSPNQIHLYQQ